MKQVLRRAHGLLVAARHKIQTVRKAAVPIVTAALGFLALPELGVDPDVVKLATAIATTLGVYYARNVAQEPTDHKAA